MNKCTLLIDFNWLTISRFSIMMDKFEKSNPPTIRNLAKQELKDTMAHSINIILNRFPCIDNIVIAADGGSWRKTLPIPESLQNITYKGNREQKIEYDWDAIFGASNELLKNCKEIGLTCTQFNNIEGDDWIWYWSRRLNADGIHCIIWSIDNDLKQLVQKDSNTGAFTVWYNDKNGLWINEELQEPVLNDIDFFMMPPTYNSPILETLKSKTKSTVNYVRPDDIILSKVICGDSGDNIKSVFRYEKNGRTYRVSEKEWNKIADEYNIVSINCLLNCIPQTAYAIANHKKYKSFHPNQTEIEEMIRYNIKLVYLNESVIPETLLITMNQQDYKEYDLSYIKSNYKMLVGEDNDIKNLFESDCPF